MLMLHLAALREDLAVAKRIILETLVVSDIPVPNSAEGIVKIIQLNRPLQRNALSSQLIAELASQISAIHSEGDRGKTRAVILASTSAGTFCSGSDMKERQSMNDGEVNTFLSEARDTFTRITQLPVPVIAALNGHVLGGGMELALTAHIRLMIQPLLTYTSS
jgi:methylglutaconyl-CoA hydratase